MRFYNQPHAFYAGVDLHARSMFTHILDASGATLFAKDLPAQPQAFLDAIKPFRKNLVVGCECMFAWYWLDDLCEDKRIPFVLGHALAMKHIHGGKAKSDKIDAGKLANMLRGGMFPLAYVYPRAKRQTRDLLRRRCFFVRQRSQLITHTAPDLNSSRLTSFKSTRFDSPANNVGPWPASLGCTTFSYSSINPNSANASGSFTPPMNSPLCGSAFRQKKAPALASYGKLKAGRRFADFVLLERPQPR